MANSDLDVLKKEAGALSFELIALDQRARRLVADFRERAKHASESGKSLPAIPDELHQMQRLRTAIVVRHLATIQATLRPAQRASLDAYVAREFAPHLSIKQASAPISSTMAENSLNPPMSKRVWCCIAILCVELVACRREPIRHGKYAGPCGSLNLSLIPIVLVGRITSDRKIGPPERVTHGHSLAIYQWFQLSIHVENVLEGNISTPEIKVYYVTNIGPSGGPARLGLRASVPGGTWQIGDREMFFFGRTTHFFVRSVTREQ